MFKFAARRCNPLKLVMGRFTTIFKAAAIAGTTATFAQAQETSQEGFVTQVNGSLRVQLNDLPPNPLLNFFGNHEDLPRNPGPRYGVPQVDKDGKPADTIGKVDERIMVRHAMRDYDPVLQMIDSSGHSFCTATIVDIDGYTVKDQGLVLATAGHCVTELDLVKGKYLGFKNPQEIYLKGSYLESGRYEEFSLPANQIWVNPLFMENNLVNKDYDLEGDTALIYSKFPTPEEVIPAVVYPFAMTESMDILSSLDEIYYRGNLPIVTVGGHSSDKPYLTTHERAEIVWGDYDGLGSLADIVPGASGGPVFMASIEYPVVKDSEGRPILLAVNSTLDLNDEGGETARHSFFSQGTMNMVPFLIPTAHSQNEKCLQVIADHLNIRVGPGVDYQPLAVMEGQTSSMLSKDSLLTVHDMAKNHLGQTWALVTTSEGRTGYVSANSDYVKTADTLCLKL